MPLAKNPHPLYAHIIDNEIPKVLEKPLKLNEYNGKRDPNEHMQLVDKCLDYFHVDEASK